MHLTMHVSNFTQGRVCFDNRQCRSVRMPKWITCWQQNPITYANKRFVRFVQQWRPLCMGLNRFPQQHPGNFRCAWIEPDKWQPLGQSMIITRELSDWSVKSIKWLQLNARFPIIYSNITSDNYCSKLGLRQPVAEAYSPQNLQYGQLLPKTRLTGLQTWPLTSEWTFGSTYPTLRQPPRPGAWLIRSASLTSWRERFIASPRINRSSSRRNSPSTGSSFKLDGRQSAFRRSGTLLINAQSISDIQGRISWAMYQSQSGESVPVTVSPPIFLNGYISRTWKKHIDHAAMSITFDRCSSTMTGVPVLTTWRRHRHILHSKSGTILTLDKISNNCPLLINGEVQAEPICYISKQFRASPLSALYQSRYIIWEKRMSAECADVSK